MTRHTAGTGVLADALPLVEAIEPSAEPSRPARNWQRHYDRVERYLLGAVGIIAVLGIWQWLATSGVIAPEFFSYPTEIIRSFKDYFGPGASGWSDLNVSFQTFAYGFLLALVVGIPLGIFMGYFRRLDALLDPLTSFFYNTPRIALAPLFVIWFGIGTESRVALVFAAAVFPLIINARAGVKGTDSVLLDMARSYGADNFKLLMSVVMPGTIPAVSSGVRIAIGQAWVGVVLAEYIASTKGLGRTLIASANTLNTTRLYDVVLVIAVLGMLLTAVFGRVENYFDRWRVR